jgi:hypothetical protein
MALTVPPYKWVSRDIKKIRDMNKKTQARFKKHLKQYETKGWSDIDTWSLDSTFAEWMLPRLKRFKELRNGIPQGYTEKTWNNTMQFIIDGFEFMASDKFYGYDGGDQNAINHEKTREALILFAKLMADGDFWW